MARATGKKSTSKSSSSTSTIPIISSDNPNLTSTPSSASLQEATASEEARSSNNSKSKPKAQSKIPTAPLDPNDAAALLATLAEQKAEIDRLRKAQASQPNSNGIKRPHGPIKNLQNAMGLKNDKSLYMNCRATISDVLAHAGIPLDLDWRHQDPIALGKVANVAKSRNKQLQLYDMNWASLEIMKSIIKNKRNYRTKIGRADPSVSLLRQSSSSGSQEAATRASDDDGNETDSDEGSGDGGGNNEDENDAGDAGTSAGTAGTKRKVTGSGGSGKGKQRKM